MKQVATTLLLALIPSALFVAALAWKIGPVVTAIYAIGIVLGVGWLMTQAWTAPLEVTREVSEDVVRRGEPVRVTVRIFNPKWWPVPWLYAEETLPQGKAKLGTTRRLLLLPPRRSFFLTYQIVPDRRGAHQLGPLVMETGDIFGLFKHSRIHPRRDFVTAVPNYQIIEEFEAGRIRRLGGLAARRSVLEDPTRVAGLREYRRGDPLNRIHWRSSARLSGLTGQLATRIFEPIAEAGATIILDFHESSWAGLRPSREETPAEEMAVEIAATIARYLSDGGWKVGLFVNGRDPLGMPGATLAQARSLDSLPDARRAAQEKEKDARLAPVSIRARRGSEQFNLILENLGRIELSDGLAIDELIWSELPYIEREQVLVFVAGRVEPPLIAALLRARELGYRILLMVVGDNPGHDRAFEALVPAGIELYRMDEEWRARELATGRQYV